jgi:hydrogenase nickel incorporation protein HypB
MCSVCGCGASHSHDNRQPDENGEPFAAQSRHPHAGGHDHHHGHGHGHDHDHARDHLHPHPHVHAHSHGQAPVHASPPLDFGAGAAGVHVPGLSQERLLRIERDVLSANAEHARANRARLRASGLLALNLVSSPGSGKTTLLVRLIEKLKNRMPVSVIEGDQQTSRDADRIRAAGAPAVQVNTGKGCHLDAHMVGHALDDLPAQSGGVLFIENVGNLVCPAGFDLGEAHKVVVLSVTEGEDKPIKYPDMFAAADLMVLNKVDLLPHLDFDVAACVAHALRANPRIQVLTVSARTGEGLPALEAWIEARAGLAAADAAE